MPSGAVHPNMAEMGPGLRREDEERDAALNHLNAPEH